MRARPLLVVTWLRATVLATLALAFATSASPVGAADVASGYQAAVREFNRLCGDPASNGRRDLWKALDAKLAALAKAAGKDPLGAKILYFEARTNAELAARSALDADYEAAAALFKRAAEAFPRHAWADDALLRRAALLADHLKRPAEARADLEELLRRYPKGDRAGEAKTRLATLAGASSGSKAADADKKNPPEKAAPSPEAKPSEPQPATSARPAVLKSAAMAPRPDGDRLTLTLSRETAYRYQILEQQRAGGDPVKRLYIDLDNTRTGQGVPAEKRYRKGAVSRLRAGYFTPDTVRVVVELEGLKNYEIHTENSPFRIVLDLTADKATAKPPRDAGEKAADKPAQQSKASADAAPGSRETRGKAAPAPPEANPRMNFRPSTSGRKNAGNLVEQLGLSVRTILIDPGHGGKDPGAQGLYGVTEKDVNLRFAKILGEILRRKGFNVLYTRTTDVFIPLETRTEMANTKGADLFVSIHCNAHGDAGSSGLETYSLNLANTRDAVRVAARENAASQKKISDLQAILTDLMLSAKTSESKDLARLVQKRAIRELRGKYATRDRGPHEAPFFVLIGANMPAVLVELGYITNPEEAKRLSSEAYMQMLAQGMVDGIVGYKKRIERYANL